MKDIKWWHRILMPDGTYTDGVVWHGPDGGDWPTQRFGIPEDLTGKRVIDIGAWDGFFSFEAEKRGADFVLATDCTQAAGGNPSGTAGFEYARGARASKVAFKRLNIERMQHEYTYDLVMCFGVLYHLKSPLLAMENLANLTTEGGTCLIETAISYQPGSLLEYKPGHDNDPTNYFYPTVNWVHDAAREAGFTKSATICHKEGRATFRLEKI